jgi:uncharacterized delta-60 repeat protein
MKKIIISLIIIFSLVNVYSYNLTKDFETSFDYGIGNDFILNIDIDSSNNIYTFGRANNGVTEDFLLVKYNNDGIYQWNRTYDSSSTDRGYGITIDNNDYIYIIGYGNPSVDTLIVKYDTEGNQIWNKSFYQSVNSIGRKIAYDINNNSLYTTGYMAGTNRDFLLMKLDLNGNHIWNRTYNGLDNSDDELYGIDIDSNGNIIVSGDSYESGELNLLIFKYDTTGNQIWNTTIDTNGNIGAPNLKVDSNNEIIISGNHASYFLLTKYDTDGNQIWNTTHASATGYALKIDSQDNIVVGSSKSGNGLIAIYNTNGTLLKNYSITTISSIEGYAMDSFGNLWAGGYVSNTNYDFHLIKFNSSVIPTSQSNEITLTKSSLPSVNIITTILILIGFFLFS